MLAQINASRRAKFRHRLTCDCVERVNKIHHTYENSFVRAIGPVGKAAIGLLAWNSRVEFPEELAGCGIEREYFLRGGNTVENAFYDDWTGLQSTLFFGVVAPGLHQPLHILSIDLGQRGVVIIFA